MAPGTLQNGSGAPYQVFSPFHRAWPEHGVHDPAPAGRGRRGQLDRGRARIGSGPGRRSRAASSRPARRRPLNDWHAWLDADSDGVDDYAKPHDFPGPDATSHLSIALRWGHLHPRTVLADLRGRAGRRARRRWPGRSAWRDFFADVLFHRPDAVTTADPGRVHRDGDRRAGRRRRWPPSGWQAWQQGRTGYPLVDAGMRQLLAEGWMHNRVRMVVASFLIKDLHIGWWHGADWFMEQLRDGDIAQNQLNWQWVAGCGTDAAPYFRVFNPIDPGEKFDARRGPTSAGGCPSSAGVADRSTCTSPGRHRTDVPAGYPRADRRPQGRAAGVARPVRRAPPLTDRRRTECEAVAETTAEKPLTEAGRPRLHLAHTERRWSEE